MTRPFTFGVKTLTCQKCGKTFRARPLRKQCNDCRPKRNELSPSNKRRFVETMMRDLGPRDY